MTSDDKNLGTINDPSGSPLPTGDYLIDGKPVHIISVVTGADKGQDHAARLAEKRSDPIKDGQLR
jgi:hypothetical protein